MLRNLFGQCAHDLVQCYFLTICVRSLKDAVDWFYEVENMFSGILKMVMKQQLQCHVRVS